MVEKADNKIKFSVVVPVLNEEKFIAKFLQSMNNQTQKNFEVIIVDNGSTDKTLEIIESEKKKINYELRVTHCTERGISYARNFGAQKAKYDYVVFFDADSKPKADWIELATKLFEKDKRTKVLGGVVAYSYKTPWQMIYYNGYTVVVFGYLYLSKLIYGKCTIPGNCMAIKKDFFFKAGAFPHLIAEDLAFSSNAYKFMKNRIEYVFNLGLVVQASSRRFEKRGMFRTIFLEQLAGYKLRKNSREYRIYR